MAKTARPPQGAAPSRQLCNSGGEINPNCISRQYTMNKITIVKIKNYLHLLAISTLITLMGCSTQKNELEDVYQENLGYLGRLNELAVIAFAREIEPDVQTKAATQNPDVQRIQVLFPVDESLIDTPDLASVSSLGDLTEIAASYAATLRLVDQSDIQGKDNVVIVSESKVKNAMSPMVRQSKDYLNSIGMTDSDIQQMLEEESADETALVPFVLALVEHDNNCYLSWLNYNRFSLIPSAYAAVSWDEVGHCALHAIGADIFYGFAGSAAKSWTKIAIKKAFKTAASKMLGPVGVAIVVIDFALCMAW